MAVTLARGFPLSRSSEAGKERAMQTDSPRAAGRARSSTKTPSGGRLRDSRTS
jgi:hypothetical protein